MAITGVTSGAHHRHGGAPDVKRSSDRGRGRRGERGAADDDAQEEGRQRLRLHRSKSKNTPFPRRVVVLGKGACGCVVSPPVDGPNDVGKVGKLIPVREEALRELQINRTVRALNAGMEYTITDVGWSGEVRVPRPVVAMCNKAPPPSDDLEFSRAYQLVYPNGGKDLPAFYDSDSDAMFEDLLPGFGTVIEGIVKLARNDLVHLDISDFNILFTRNIGRRSDGG